MTVKLIGALMLIFCGALTGMTLGKKERQRILLTEQALLFLLTVKQRLSYSTMITSELLQSVFEEIYGEEKFTSLNETVLLNLKEDDRKTVLSALSLIGRSDLKTQENQLSEFILRMEKSLEELKRETPLKQRLLLTVSTMAGVCTAIFLM